MNNHGNHVHPSDNQCLTTTSKQLVKFIVELLFRCVRVLQIIDDDVIITDAFITVCRNNNSDKGCRNICYPHTLQLHVQHPSTEIV